MFKQFKQNLKYAMRAMCFVGTGELRPRQRNVMNHMDHVLCMGMCFFGGFIVKFFCILFCVICINRAGKRKLIN